MIYGRELTMIDSLLPWINAFYFFALFPAPSSPAKARLSTTKSSYVNSCGRAVAAFLLSTSTSSTFSTSYNPFRLFRTIFRRYEKARFTKDQNAFSVGRPVSAQSFVRRSAKWRSEESTFGGG